MRRSVATRTQLITHKFEHAFPSLTQSLLQLLHRRHSPLSKRSLNASAHGKQSCGESTLNDAFVVVFADCEHFGRRGQRVGHDKGDGSWNDHILGRKLRHEADVLSGVELAHDGDSLVHATTGCASVALGSYGQVGQLGLINAVK